MPLRDHFHPPVSKRSRWDTLYAGWPAVIVQKLNDVLPDGFAGGPIIRAGLFDYEDLPPIIRRNTPFSTKELFRDTSEYPSRVRAPNIRTETSWGEYDEFQVRARNRHAANELVSTIEVVSPGNKRSAAARSAFVTRCIAALMNGVAVTIVDVVTSHPYNLYHELLSSLGYSDPTMSTDPPDLYAATVRLLLNRPRSLLECLSERLVVGQPLPKLPLWLDETLAVPLELERSYEQTCHDLRIE